ncbi:MAG: acetate--CoA ligase family protein [Deltaproteobacteria bacterium]|nr:acetate--CoA ligase family protein [Deltaproteobacteria bacterium]
MQERLRLAITATLSAATFGGRDVLFEHELLEALALAGIRVPALRFIPKDVVIPQDVAPAPSSVLEGFSASRAVLKVVSPRILHKSDVGGVAVIDDPSPARVAERAQAMLAGLPVELQAGVEGFVLEEAVSFTPGVGHELLVGMRRSPDFGSIYTLGFGGTYVEALAKATHDDQSTILVKPGFTTDPQLQARFDAALFYQWTSGGVRGVKGVTSPSALRKAFSTIIASMEAVREAVEEVSGREVLEFELNPIVWAEGDGAAASGWVPVDALLRLGEARQETRRFPLPNLKQGLAPRSVAMVGVSTKMNMGRIILRSLLAAGFEKARTYVVREGSDEIDGVRCVPNVAALPEAVDLMVLAVPAPAVPEVLRETFEAHQAKTVLLIPGGMGETEGGKGIAEQVDALLAEYARDEARPVLVGNNSVGLVCRRSSFDSLFIPKEKLPRRDEGLAHVAFITQSGAFMLTQMGKMPFVTPDFQLSIGNQVDARMSDFVEALADDDALETFALYVEGLKSGDGEALAHAVRKLTARGKDAIIYKAGRSGLGQAATMGHTASVAGDYRVFESMLRDAGALVVDTLGDFLDLVKLSALLGKKRFGGRGTAFLSNAGYEVVSMADSHSAADYALEAATFSDATSAAIHGVLETAKIHKLITVTNPLDLTPMANDAVHAACIEAIFADEGVHCGIFGMVPFTPAVLHFRHGALHTRGAQPAQGALRA